MPPQPAPKPDGTRATRRRSGNPKQAQLERETAESRDTVLTTNQGVPVSDDQNSLKAGERGPSLLEDFHLREKITHFDHERIPERVVHARGSAAHGVFRVYQSMASITRAKFLSDPSLETPVFVRFSTVAGSRGSTDLARDVRGFAVKFYTDEGNFDLVGNNMPVFFIQDAIKFPDLIHAVKPEPANEIPQAASAHDTFWDFISLMPESMHMIMWLMSDRAIPRSLRMMEGFGVHTFRLVNDAGTSCFVKFHWKPLLGVHSVAWDEAQKISGKDPDFHRRDLWDAIAAGTYPEWELGLQIVPEEDQFAFGFDLLDPTKLIPEELVPVRRVGKLTLNRNPDNFFAETEQVAFHVGNVVSGIDFTNDPLLQGRLFSYTDTQLLRLGGPNFHEIPINRPTSPAHNHQRDGFGRQTISAGQVSYQPNSLGQNFPEQATRAAGGFVTVPDATEGTKVRARGESFFDHYSQARMFFRSQSEPEQQHLIKALRFELGKVKTSAIRERMVAHLAQIDDSLAASVGKGIGTAPERRVARPPNLSVPAGGDPAAFQHRDLVDRDATSSALSMAVTGPGPITTRRIAILVTPLADGAGVRSMLKGLKAAGAVPALVAPNLGVVMLDDGSTLPSEYSILTASSVLFDAVYVAGGTNAAGWAVEADAIEFVKDAYKHCKVVAATGEGVQLLEAAGIPVGAHGEPPPDEATLAADSVSPAFARRFVQAVGRHRLWSREPTLHLAL